MFSFTLWLSDTPQATSSLHKPASEVSGRRALSTSRALHVRSRKPLRAFHTVTRTSTRQNKVDFWSDLHSPKTLKTTTSSIELRPYLSIMINVYKVAINKWSRCQIDVYFMTLFPSILASMYRVLHLSHCFAPLKFSGRLMGDVRSLPNCRDLKSRNSTTKISLHNWKIILLSHFSL